SPSCSNGQAILPVGINFSAVCFHCNISEEKSTVIQSAPVLLAPPGIQYPSGCRWLYNLPSASTTCFLVTPLMTNVVPIVVVQSPRLTAPDATWLAQPAVIQTITSISFSHPGVAKSFCNRPTTVPGGTTVCSHSFFNPN